MRPSPGTIVKVGIVCLVVVAVCFVAFDNHDKQAVKSASAQPTTTAAPTSTQSKTTTRTAVPRNKPKSKVGVLKTQVVGFLRSYYLRLPHDTAAIRRRRVTPYVSSFLLTHLDMGIAKGQDAETIRQEGLAVHAEVTTAQVHLKVFKGRANTQTAKTAVKLWVTRQDSPTQNYFTIVTTARWHYRDGRWTIDSFNSEGG